MQNITISFVSEEFRLKLDDLLIWEEMIHLGGRFYEHPMLKRIYELVQSGKIADKLFIDCGANFGNHTVFFAALCADKVIAFEPAPENFELLKENCRVNNCDNVVLHQAGVSDKMEKACIKKGARWSQCKVVPGEGDIQLFTIDSMRLSECSAIKIDVEDMEMAVLKGAKKTIARFKPDIFIEVWADTMLQEITTLLRGFGYELKERYNHAPTYHFSVNDDIPVTYTKPEVL